MAWPEACGRAFCGATLPSHGASLAVGDIDGDGRPDLLLGEAGPALGDLGALTVLRNTGDGFVDATGSTGLAGYGAWSAVFADVDDDGDDDLVLGGRRVDGVRAERGAVMVFTNDGAGRFSLAVEDVDGASERGAPIALDVADLDRDGVVDVVVGRATSDAARPARGAVMMGRLGLRFARAEGVAEAGGSAWVAMATDLSGDGRLDLLFCRDGFTVIQAPDDHCAMTTGARVPAWRNSAWVVDAAPGAFAASRASLGETFDSRDFTPMGVAVGDFNDDGRLDYVMTRTEGPALFASGAGVMPGEAGGATGLELPDGMRRAATSWSALARDIDRDGRDDVLVTYGEIPGRPRSDEVGNAVYLGREGGRFTAMPGETGFALRASSWSSMVTADFDGDGDDDVVVGAQTLYRHPCGAEPEGAALLRNDVDVAGRRWARVRLVGTVSSRDAVGARVEAPAGERVIVRQASRAGATMGSSGAVVDLGLGDVARLPWLRVRWPSGAVTTLRDVAVDRSITVEEPRWLTVSREGEGRGVARVVSAREPTMALDGDARWSGAAERDGEGWARRFEGRGEVLVRARAEGGLDAGRRVGL